MIGQQNHRLEIRIGNLLRIGVLLAAAVVLTGGVAHLFRAYSSVVSYREFRGEPRGLTRLPGIFEGAVHLQAVPIIQFGLVLLVATPIVRVVFALIGFYVERDWLYVLNSTTVLLILAYSLFRVA